MKETPTWKKIIEDCTNSAEVSTKPATSFMSKKEQKSVIDKSSKFSGNIFTSFSNKKFKSDFDNSKINKPTNHTNSKAHITFTSEIQNKNCENISLEGIENISAIFDDSLSENEKNVLSKNLDKYANQNTKSSVPSKNLSQYMMSLSSNKEIVSSDLKNKNVNKNSASNLSSSVKKPDIPATKSSINLVFKAPGLIYVSPVSKTLSSLFACYDPAKVVYSPKNSQWTIDPEYYLTILSDLKKYFKFLEIPRGLLKFYISSLSSSTIDHVVLNERLDRTLLPFQKEAVKLAIQRKGRILLADEMGLGKTYQALAIAFYYRLEWPLFIIAPASLLENWQQSIKYLFDQNSVIIRKTEDFGEAISICSYDMAARLFKNISNQKFKVIIADECHYLKSSQSKRCSSLLNILQSSSRLIMLSGTPATSRPIELYTTITALCKNAFKTMSEYGYRYCSLKKIGHYFDWKGCSNSDELVFFLNSLFMIRRGKSEVLNQLPLKTRKQIILKISKRKIKRVEKNLQRNGTSSNHNTFSSNKSNEGSKRYFSGNLNSLMGDKPDPTIMQLYNEAAEIKLPVVCSYIETLLLQNKKLVVFAHHATMLNGLEEFLKTKVKLIRIDGKTLPQYRQKLVDTFQNDKSIMVALLSITACSTGITLTEGKSLVFAELYWNPGTLLQAEDRIHRIGQKDNVNIYFLTANGTVDEQVWPILLKKMTILEKCGVGKNELKDMQNEVVGKESILNFCTVDEFVQKNSYSEEEDGASFSDDFL